jgi:hypothetical protein
MGWIMGERGKSELRLISEKISAIVERTEMCVA